METEKVTLKQLAEQLHLSIGTVQRALNNKGGYTEETRQRVLAQAEKCGYHVNHAASSLRRKPVTIAVVLPEPSQHNRYFYRSVWQGLEEAAKELSVYQVKLERYYANVPSEVFYQHLQNILSTHACQGLITAEVRTEQFETCMKKFQESGIPVMKINAIHSLSQAMPSPRTGELAADIFAISCKQHPGQVLLLGGSTENELHRTRCQEFKNRLRACSPNLSVLEIYQYHELEKLEQLIPGMVQSLPQLQGIFAVSARETLTMCKAISSLELSSPLVNIGVDAFPELLEYFRNQSLTASIYHYPSRFAYALMYQLAHQLCGIQIPHHAEQIPTVPVFASNAAFFCTVQGYI